MTVLVCPRRPHRDTGRLQRRDISATHGRSFQQAELVDEVGFNPLNSVRGELTFHSRLNEEELFDVP